MKLTRAKTPPASKVTRKEKLVGKAGSLFGHHPAPKLPRKKPSTPAIGRQYGQAHLAPKHKKI